MALYKYSNDLSSRLPLSNNLYARLQADILTNKIAAGEKLTAFYLRQTRFVGRYSFF